jgi:hypothetical protein
MSRANTLRNHPRSATRRGFLSSVALGLAPRSVRGTFLLHRVQTRQFEAAGSGPVHYFQAFRKNLALCKQDVNRRASYLTVLALDDASLPGSHWQLPEGAHCLAIDLDQSGAPLVAYGLLGKSTSSIWTRRLLHEGSDDRIEIGEPYNAATFLNGWLIVFGQTGSIFRSRGGGNPAERLSVPAAVVTPLHKLFPVGNRFVCAVNPAEGAIALLDVERQQWQSIRLAAPELDHARRFYDGMRHAATQRGNLLGSTGVDPSGVLLALAQPIRRDSGATLLEFDVLSGLVHRRTALALPTVAERPSLPLTIVMSGRERKLVYTQGFVDVYEVSG